MTRRAIAWAKKASNDPAFSRIESGRGQKTRRSTASSALEMAASMVLGRIRNSNDLQAMLRALVAAPEEVRREFLEWLGDSRFMLRGVFGQAELLEFDRGEPRWQDVVTAVQHLFQVAIGLNLIHVARLCAGEIVKIIAGPLNNPAQALDELTKIEHEIGTDPLVSCARAHALFRAAHYDRALDLWQTVLPDSGDPADLQSSDEARYAAMAAAALGRYKDAKHWLLWARERLSEEYFGLSRAVLAVDAAFASWKAFEDMEACRLLRLGIRELAAHA